MDIIDVDYIEVPDDPITETWYTCPSCGCLSRTGEICACGYHPPKAAAAAPACRKWPIIAVAVLAVALACSLFYNVEQKNKILQKDADLNRLQSYSDECREKIVSLNEYNKYLIEDLEHLCDPLYTDFESTKFRHDVRSSSNPFVRPQPSEENVFYWMLMALRNKNGELDY